MEIRKVKDVVMLRLSSADLADPVALSEVVEGLLLTDGERKFVADLTAIQTVTSLQAGTLVTLHLLCYENLAVMKLFGVSARVKTVLKLIGMEKLMEVHHGAEIARASFGPPDEPPPAMRPKRKA